jgi:hypothetical protein
LDSMDIRCIIDILIIKMKKSISFLIAFLFSLYGCAQNDNLTPAESALAVKTGFDSSILTELKAITGKEIKQLPTIDQETGDIITAQKYNGIYCESSENEVVGMVKKLKSKFSGNSYLVFAFDDGEGNKSVAVIKGSNELDILRYRRTDGINYGIDNTAVVKKITQWQKKYGLTVIGCGRDWLQVEFDKLPANADQFAKEVYKFCPDIVDQGVGDIESLKAAIKEMHGVALWWD